jgi:hypothetical protein
MDKLDIVIGLIEEALEESDWSKIEEVYGLLRGQYEDLSDGYNLEGLENAGHFVDDFEE